MCNHDVRANAWAVTSTCNVKIQVFVIPETPSKYSSLLVVLFHAIAWYSESFTLETLGFSFVFRSHGLLVAKILMALNNEVVYKLSRFGRTD